MIIVQVETRKKVVLGDRTRIVVSDAGVPEHMLLEVIRETPVDGARICTWPDGHVELFNWNSALQLIGPGDSRLLPENLRHAGTRWYVESGRIYSIEGNQVRRVAEVPRAQAA